MKNKFKLLFLALPAFLLSSCDFTYTYIVAGLDSSSGGGDVIDDGIEDSGTYDIKIWVDDAIVDLTRTQVQQFVTDNGSKYKINLTIEPQSEGNAASSMLQDVTLGADIFAFAQDQLARLKVAGAVGKLNSTYLNVVTERNSEDSIQAATLGSSVYAFPLTNDNGYFLYYDKRVISEEDAKSVTKIMQKCKAAGKTFNFPARGDGFYSASYFLGAGCKTSWDIDEVSGSFTAFHDDFNSANGLKAAKGLREVADKSIVSTDAIASRLGEKSAALVSGIWNYEVAKNRLGDNLGCAELPSYTVDGENIHLGSYDGFKLLGVKPQVDSKKASVCRKLALYLTSETCQTERFHAVSWGPTNVNSAKEEAVVNHPGLAALAKQHEYATIQSQCPGTWYLHLATTAKAIELNSTDAQLQAALTNYKNGLPDLLSED